MESLALKRSNFQGVWNIVRFNWHFFLLSFGICLLLLFGSTFFDGSIAFLFIFLSLSIFITSVVSLLVSYYVYDLSDLYELNAIPEIDFTIPLKLTNIHAGFDETSCIFEHKFINSELKVFDFYDPEKHTEVSIKRARRAYPPHKNNQVIQTNQIPLENASMDFHFNVLSAHEIRSEEERIQFFKEQTRTLKETGNIVVTEHLRDLPNFLAYTIGFFHFHSHQTWLNTFDNAGLKVKREIKTTPFISTFILVKK